MKLLVSHESPINLLCHSLDYNDYQYCLVHLMETNEQYREWFLNVNARTGAEVLLDNSIFELREAFDSTKYAEWVKKINPNYYIIPDVLEDTHGTIKKWNEFNSIYANDKITGPEKIGVVQGKTWNDLVVCYKFMSTNADYIAISFDYSYYTITGVGDTNLQLWCSGRQRFIQQLIDEGIWNWDKPHHLLGCSLAKEFKYYVNNNIYNIRSCDTSNPIVAALQGLQYNGDFGLKIKPSTLLADLINAKVDDDTIELAYYNTSQFKRIIGR